MPKGVYEHSTKTISRNLSVGNDLTVANDITATGNIEGYGLTITNNATIQNDLTVNGSITCSSLITAIFKTIYPIGAVFISYESFHSLGYTQTSTSPVRYSWNDCVWEFMNNEHYLRNGKVIGTYEQAATDDGGSESFTLSTDNIPQHTHTFTGTSASGRIVIRNSQYSTVNNTSGVFSHETNPNTYNTQLEIYSDPGNCSMQNVKFNHTPSGTLNNVGKNPPDAITHIPPYRTVFIYRRIQ